MHHIVLLSLQLSVIVSATVENEISRLHLLKLELNGKSVNLIALIPSVKVEAKLFPEVIDDLPNQSTAIEEDRCIIVLVSWLPIPLRVGHSKVFLCRLKELFSESLLEGRILFVYVLLLRHVLAVLYLLFLLISEALEVLLKTGLVVHHEEFFSGFILDLWF